MESSPFRKSDGPYESNGMIWCDTCQQSLPVASFDSFAVERQWNLCKKCGYMLRRQRMKDPYRKILTRLRERERKRGTPVPRTIHVEQIKAYITKHRVTKKIPVTEIRIVRKDIDKPWSFENCKIERYPYRKE